MRTRVVQALFAQALVTATAFGQPELPPPPPPPIGQTPELPPPPPPTVPSSAAPTPAPAPPPPPRAPAPRRALPPPPPVWVPPPPQRAPRRLLRTESEVVVVEERSRPFSLTFNPLPIALGRLSGNIEVRLARHHSVIAAPNILVAQVGRGGSGSLVSEGFGFASAGSAGVGIELGYHYWWRGHPQALRGPFLGPSLLLGTTTQATAGDPSHAQLYAGVAFDVGAQEVFAGGFTLGGGVGIGFLRMADAAVFVPRILLQVGWSF